MIISNNRFKNVYFINSNYVKQDFSYNKFKKIIPDFTNDILCRSLYDIEILYLINKIGSDNFKIVDIDYNYDDSKTLFIRIEGSDRIKKVIIPKLDIYYSEKELYKFVNVYFWLTKKGIRKVTSDRFLINFNEKRFYKVGDVNKYGHKLLRIERDKILSHVVSYKSMVGLRFI